MTNTIKNHSVKITIGTIITVFIFIIGTTVNLTNSKNKIEDTVIHLNTQYDHCLKWYKELDEKQEIIKEANQKQDLIIMEISTKLTNIEALLLDLKKNLEK